ncbi:rod shape-determining protein MreD [Terrabacter sp. Ter38]|uniref:rod shape-determining protein MreD n=1 Tax=Terrabacter sp. Ter38 TaxID=2926030 RepID=UPI0021198FAD|nr:rod shape-determining protein MreD [Terrabacter sp. Ter38]
MRPSLLGLLRTAYVLVAALVVATLLPRLGAEPRWVPDLVLVGVVATAVLRGPVHGALVGLLAGWVVELVPPVGSPLGLTPLVMMLAGLVAGLFRRSSSRSPLRAPAALLAAAAVVLVGRLGSAVLSEGSVELTDGLWRLLVTVLVGGLLLPALLALDRALVRRRLG